MDSTSITNENLLRFLRYPKVVVLHFITASMGKVPNILCEPRYFTSYLLFSVFTDLLRML